MLAELLLAALFAPMSSCDTARAALGTCNTQLSTSVGSGQTFELTLSREISVPGSHTSQPGGTSTSIITSPAPSTSAPKPASTTKPATTATPLPAATATKPTTTNSGCPVLDPPQARLYMPPCSPTSTTPAAPATGVSRPATPATGAARPAPTATQQVATGSSPATSVSTPASSITEQDAFAAQVPSPRLTLVTSPVRVGAAAQFRVSAVPVINYGSLLGQPAEIRFRPVSAVIRPGDGAALSGFSATHRYQAVGWYLARAVVGFQIDYRLGSGSWVLNAATLDSSSNSVRVEVLEPRKRSLLVD